VGAVVGSDHSKMDRKSSDCIRSPEIRRGFRTVPEARMTLARHPSLQVKGDLQMHTAWSDGSGLVGEMARAASDRRYEYLAITDHS
jgi:hypothetical protein